MTTSIGSILKKARERKRLTLDDVYRTVKIHPKYILALEKTITAFFLEKYTQKGFSRFMLNFWG